MDGKLHYSPDVTIEPNYVYALNGSEVDVPLIVAGEVKGVLTAESTQKEAFFQDDFEVLTAVAQQTGVAIEKARLLSRERRRADELEALGKITADITAELDLDRVLKAIVQQSTELLGSSGGELALYDEKHKELRLVVSHNFDIDHTGSVQRVGEGLMGKVAESGETIVLEDYQTWENAMPTYQNIHAAMAVPLSVRGNLIGVFTVAGEDPNKKFDSSDLNLLEMFAQQASIAIENARLFEKTLSNADELAVLNELAQKFTRQLSVDRVLEEVYLGVSRLVDTTNFYIAIHDPETDMVSFPFNITESVLDREIITLPANKGITGYIIKNRTSILAEKDVVKYLQTIGVDLVGEGPKCYLGVPIMIGEKVLGAMAVQSFESAHAYDRHDHDLLSSIASQAAVAIENARLFDQAQKEIIERKKYEKEITRQKEYFESLFVYNPSAAVVVDDEVNIVSWNPAAEKLFGYSEQEIRGKNLDDIVTKDLGLLSEAREYSKQALEMQHFKGNGIRTRKDGSLVEVEIIAMPIVVDDVAQG